MRSRKRYMVLFVIGVAAATTAFVLSWPKVKPRTRNELILKNFSEQSIRLARINVGGIDLELRDVPHFGEVTTTMPLGATEYFHVTVWLNDGTEHYADLGGSDSGPMFGRRWVLIVTDDAIRGGGSQITP